MAETLHYDVAIIGAGPAGLAAAEDVKAAGKSVVLIEKYLWGGTCPNYGCDPKKILLAAVEAKEHVEFLRGDGVDGKVDINWEDLMGRKMRFTEAIPDKTVHSLDANGIGHIYGAAHFINEDTVIVHGDEDVEVRATDWILTAGQRPAELEIPGAEYTINSEQFLSLAEMPEDIVIIGGGYIAVEFASIAAAAGAQVHLVVRGSELLSEFDEAFVDTLFDQLDDRGIRIYFNTEVTEVAKTDDGYSATLSFGSTIPAGVVVRAVGRVGNNDTLQLENAGVEDDIHGINVDEFLRTSNPHIYAAGDVANTSKPRITTVGYYEARYAASVILGHDQPIEYPAVPVVVYGTPKLAAVGVPTQYAEENGYSVRDIDMTNWFTYYRTGEPAARAKVVLDADKKLVGATVLSAHADELINYFTEAINNKDGYQAIRDRLYAYPTPASDLEYFF
ncbi:dihydrolipoyl dehydrogenase family protein [Weissella confusa]|uniref:dihydrolipoyl dehydrogenase family protein n=1 Tax=Weissella confusa TaxID=1583 RepID=UPI0018F1AD20|nr:NAD(P)/FAD-dependent oxidoreductase [Weissella confusa]MBJ7648926.1 NAD(P)/FAD-dependent oxidoreductase [Weissella confusa]MBJ7661267.1 NAD(P)/FAD-dependent oxidoreductase [Weissella confusa]